jgi:hypothetical protein
LFLLTAQIREVMLSDLVSYWRSIMGMFNVLCPRPERDRDSTIADFLQQTYVVPESEPAANSNSHGEALLRASSTRIASALASVAVAVADHALSPTKDRSSSGGGDGGGGGGGGGNDSPGSPTRKRKAGASAATTPTRFLAAIRGRGRSSSDVGAHHQDDDDSGGVGGHGEGTGDRGDGEGDGDAEEEEGGEAAGAVTAEPRRIDAGAAAAAAARKNPKGRGERGRGGYVKKFFGMFASVLTGTQNEDDENDEDANEENENTTRTTNYNASSRDGTPHKRKPKNKRKERREKSAAAVKEVREHLRQFEFDRQADDADASKVPVLFVFDYGRPRYGLSAASWMLLVLARQNIEDLILQLNLSPKIILAAKQQVQVPDKLLRDLGASSSRTLLNHSLVFREGESEDEEEDYSLPDFTLMGDTAAAAEHSDNEGSADHPPGSSRRTVGGVGGVGTPALSRGGSVTNLHPGGSGPASSRAGGAGAGAGAGNGGGNVAAVPASSSSNPATRLKSPLKISVPLPGTSDVTNDESEEKQASKLVPIASTSPVVRSLFRNNSKKW